MKFKLLDAVFKINGDQLEVNNQPYECKKNTLDTLLIFLQSDGAVVSKDDILSQVCDQLEEGAVRKVLGNMMKPYRRALRLSFLRILK